MIKFEYPVTIFGVIRDNLCRHSSDAGMQIRKVGTDEIYAEAIDICPCAYSYEETDIPIE